MGTTARSGCPRLPAQHLSRPPKHCGRLLCGSCPTCAAQARSGSPVSPCFYGLLGFAGLAGARGTIVQLGTGWQVGVAVTALAAISLAALAIYWAYRAAYGWPKVRSVRDDEELLAWYADQLAAPARSAVMLRAGVRSAGASLGALVVLFGLLWFAPTQSPGVPMIRTTLRDGSVLCGTVQASAQNNAVSMRQFSRSTVISIPFSQINGLTSVSSC